MNGGETPHKIHIFGGQPQKHRYGWHSQSSSIIVRQQFLCMIIVSLMTRRVFVELGEESVNVDHRLGWV